MPNATSAVTSTQANGHASPQPSKRSGKKNRNKGSTANKVENAQGDKHGQEVPTTPVDKNVNGVIDTETSVPVSSGNESPVIPHGSVDNGSDPANKNKYIEVVAKRLRAEKKRMLKIEKAEALLNSGPEGKSKLHAEQLQNLERKNEVSTTIRMFEEVLQSMAVIEAEELKNKLRQKKAQEAERAQAIEQALKEQEAKTSVVEHFRELLTNKAADSVEEELRPTVINEIMTHVRKLKDGVDEIITRVESNETDVETSSGITYANIHAWSVNPPIEEDPETFQESTKFQTETDTIIEYDGTVPEETSAGSLTSEYVQQVQTVEITETTITNATITEPTHKSHEDSVPIDTVVITDHYTTDFSTAIQPLSEHNLFTSRPEEPQTTIAPTSTVEEPIMVPINGNEQEDIPHDAQGQTQPQALSQQPVDGRTGDQGRRQSHHQRKRPSRLQSQRGDRHFNTQPLSPSSHSNPNQQLQGQGNFSQQGGGYSGGNRSGFHGQGSRKDGGYREGGYRESGYRESGYREGGYRGYKDSPREGSFRDGRGNPARNRDNNEQSQLVEKEFSKLRVQESPESASKPSHSLEEALSSTNSAPPQRQENENAANESLYDQPTTSAVSTELKGKGKAVDLDNTVTNASDSTAAPLTTPPKPTRTTSKDSEKDSVATEYQLKALEWFDIRSHKLRKVKIITQNENGPCPLLALCNVLILRNDIEIRPYDRPTVSYEYLVELLGDYLLKVIPQNEAEINPKSGGDKKNSNSLLRPSLHDYQHTLDTALSIIPSLQTGLDVNVRFNSIHGFEPTAELSVFDIFNVDLVHGWVVDPQETEFWDVLVGKCGSYNRAVECVVRGDHLGKGVVVENVDRSSGSDYGKFTSGDSLDAKDKETVRDAFVVSQFLDRTATQLTYHDASFAHERSIVWESLRDVDQGASEFVNWQFEAAEISGGDYVDVNNNASSENIGGGDQDYALALSLQEEEAQGAAREAEFHRQQLIQKKRQREQEALRQQQLQAQLQRKGDFTGGRYQQKNSTDSGSQKRKTRPPSAAPESDSSSEEESATESLSTEDAYMFPLIGSGVLFGLYVIFQLFNKEYVNYLVTAYFGFLGVAATTTVGIYIVKKTGNVKLDPYKVVVTRKAKEIYRFSFSTIQLGVAVGSVFLTAYYVLTKNWIASNILGLSFAFNGIQMLSLDSFKTGVVLLSGLFLYDIFWVFGTEVMVSVAKSFDAPVKVLWPKHLFGLGSDIAVETPQFTMLGLGDIVIPGIFVALCLRLDHALYLKENPNAHKNSKYPTVYFKSCLASYIVGLVTTIIVMHTFKAAQPALLYLSPACILSVFITGSIKVVKTESSSEGGEEDVKLKPSDNGDGPGAVTGEEDYVEVTSTRNRKSKRALKKK
ncbi:819_t:CDS:10 [Paraglomus occultum]|uniref:819_t:CDS:1 n=1 Tax=Paraglomus occultum TaxID=144539 RepID=A0A9N9EZK6_9GLOM|nr:819_t:CDS:10 [Paraglomus occultum]